MFCILAPGHEICNLKSAPQRPVHSWGVAGRGVLRTAGVTKHEPCATEALEGEKGAISVIPTGETFAMSLVFPHKYDLYFSHQYRMAPPSPRPPLSSPPPPLPPLPHALKTASHEFRLNVPLKYNNAISDSCISGIKAGE